MDLQFLCFIESSSQCCCKDKQKMRITAIESREYSMKPLLFAILTQFCRIDTKSFHYFPTEHGTVSAVGVCTTHVGSVRSAGARIKTYHALGVEREKHAL